VPGILENDFRDPDGDTQRAVLSEGPMHGDLVFSENGDGAFIYIPDPAYVGVDSFLYNVTDDFYFIWSGANPVNSANFGSVQIVVFGPGDHDADGISDSVEALAPNGGDIDNATSALKCFRPPGSTATWNDPFYPMFTPPRTCPPMPPRFHTRLPSASCTSES
jgi:hypothetical protein